MQAGYCAANARSPMAHTVPIDLAYNGPPHLHPCPNGDTFADHGNCAHGSSLPVEGNGRRWG